MTEDTNVPEPAPADFFEQIAEAAAEDVPKILARLRDIAKDGGVRTVRVRCSKCGQYEDAEVPIANVEEMRKVLDTFASIQLRARAAKQDDDASVAGRKILRAIEEMSSEEIATELAELESSG